MTWHLLAVFISGLSLGGIAYLLRSLSRQRLPKWLIPAFAGAGMLGYLAYYDYTWYDFKRSQLPAGALVFDTTRGSSFFKPWSYVSPAINAFSVADGNFRAQDQAGTQVVEYLAYEFSKDPVERMRTRLHVLNCSSFERVSIDPEHPQAKAELSRISSADPVFVAACEGRQERNSP
ncbi:MAG: hypothetical protein RBR77_14570 [Thauera sp.]|jgi:hypothetical protein|nr:hypothetical protein [Thauera sp.]